MNTDSLKRITASLLLMVQVSLVPMAAYADDVATESPVPTESATPTPEVSTSPSATPSASPESSPAATPSTEPSPLASPSAAPAVGTSPAASPSPTTGAGVTGPTGPTGPTGTTGTIPKYAFNMTTRVWVPTDQSSFTWDPKTGYWLSPLYQYDKAKGYYEIFSPDQPTPEGLLTAAGAVLTPLGLVAPGSQKYELAKSLGLLPADPSFGSTGPDSTNSVTETTNNGVTFDLTNLVNVINAIQSNAGSGDATASGNTKAGDVSTGNAAVVATLVNLLSSAWSWSNGALNFFVNNLFGDHNGDINLKPTESVSGGGGAYGANSFGTTGPNSTNSIATDTNNNLNVRQSDGAAITNNLDLAAQSGDATASHNSSVGSASTGDATVEANLINLINSYISSGDSFFGILNIFGNLNGDILFPTGFLDAALGSGSGTQNTIGTTGPDSTNTIDSTTNNTANVTTNTDHRIANNINTSAQSGSANVAGNSVAGNATTGDASTSNALYNLDNTNLFGDNAVLVIVNVMGHWIGHIMNLPNAGNTSSALLTGGATTNTIGTTGPGSTNTIDSTTNNTANINASQRGSITNNINATAQSGDATLTGNSSAGSATTGAAKVMTNTANIINSGINVKHWFGVLIVNVVGDWFGSVNDDTAAGEVIGGKGGGQPVHALAQIAAPAQSKQAQSATVTNRGAGGSSHQVVAPVPSTVISSQLAAKHDPIVASTAKAAAKDHSSTILFAASALIMMFASALAVFERRMKKLA